MKRKMQGDIKSKDTDAVIQFSTYKIKEEVIISMDYANLKDYGIKHENLGEDKTSQGKALATVSIQYCDDLIKDLKSLRKELVKVKDREIKDLPISPSQVNYIG